MDLQTPPHIPRTEISPCHGIKIQVFKLADIAGALLVSLPNLDEMNKPPWNFREADFKLTILSKDELIRLNKFKALKKQIEWLCGRFAAKSLAKEVLTPDQEVTGIRIEYREKGAPFLVRFPDHCLSLSHSGTYTVVALGTDSGLTLGIDVEKVTQKPGQAFMKTAFTPEEIQAMGNTPQEIFRHWTLKEAYLKYIGLGFNESLKQVEIIRNKIFHNKTPQDLGCWSWPLGRDYVLSLVADLSSE